MQTARTAEACIMHQLHIVPECIPPLPPHPASSPHALQSPEPTPGRQTQAASLLMAWRGPPHLGPCVLIQDLDSWQHSRQGHPGLGIAHVAAQRKPAWQARCGRACTPVLAHIHAGLCSLLHAEHRALGQGATGRSDASITQQASTDTEEGGVPGLSALSSHRHEWEPGVNWATGTRVLRWPSLAGWRR